MKNLKPLISAFMLTATSMVFANPEGFQTLVGDASLAHPNAKTVEVTTGKQAIIQWDSFSIEKSETTRFVMPDSTAAVLNRVMGGKMSEILGTLEANGKVFLVNPKGVLVGEDANVNTASFIASSFDVLNDEFMSGGDIAFKGNSGSVINLGKITAWDGDVFLVGYQVTNDGNIEAPNGVAGLAAGTEVLLRSASNEKILIRAQLTEAVADVGIQNTGAISALQAELKADGNMYAYAIKDSGKIDALAKCRRIDSRIMLVAENGSVETSGELTAAGGEVRVLGNEVSVLSGAHINVSSENGGGVALIGGDFQGSNPEIVNATYVRVEENAVIEANATMEGDGGKVILWGNDLTSFFGDISAEGGLLAGNGGFVEVSSSGLIVPVGNVSTMAPNGLTGNLLLDPCAVTIAPPSATESGFAQVGSCAMPPASFTFSGATSTIYASRINSLLACTNVTVDASASGSAGSGNITVAAQLNWSSANSLTLTANDGLLSFVRFLSNVNAASGTLTVNGGIVQVGDINQMLTNAVTVNAQTTNITASNLSVFGSNNTGASGRILGKTITLNVANALNVIGGDAQSAFASITSTGTPTSLGVITCNVAGPVTLTAGDGVSSSAAITGTNANITLGSMMTPVDSLTITGSDVANYANAFISTNSAGFIEIQSTNDVTLDAGIQPGCNADIFTVGADGYDTHINVTTVSGDVVLKGGGA